MSAIDWVARQDPQLHARLFAVVRIAAGAAVLTAPGPVSQRWLRAPGPSPEALTALRMVAGRELALGLGALLAVRRRPEAARGWLEVGSVVDAVDAYALGSDRAFTPVFSYPFAAIAAVSALFEMLLARRVPRSR